MANLQNIAKGIRRIDGLCEGDLEGTKQFLDVRRVLDQTVCELELAEKQEAEAGDKIWRENFETFEHDMSAPFRRHHATARSGNHHRQMAWDR